MNALTYCQLAVSKDSSRPNLCEVYRAETALFATDGHRLHFCRNLPATKPHFPSGLDDQFLDCEAAMPNGAPLSTATIRVTKEALAALKSLAKVYGKSRSKKILLTYDGEEVTLAGKHCSPFKEFRTSFSVSLPYHYKDSSSSPFSISVNLDYLIDALPIPKGEDAIVVTIEFRGETCPLMVLPYFEGVEHGNIGAVVASMRADD